MDVKPKNKKDKKKKKNKNKRKIFLLTWENNLKQDKKFLYNKSWIEVTFKVNKKNKLNHYR